MAEQDYDHKPTKAAVKMRLKTKRWPVSPCHRLRINVFAYRRCVVRTVFPGNPREEWLWFKYCLRKGIFLYIRPSRVILFRQVQSATSSIRELYLLICLILSIARTLHLQC